MKPHPPLFTTLDLFSGTGDFAHATAWAGGRTLAFCESAKSPGRILKSRWPEIPNYRDVSKLCRRIHDCVPTDDDSGNVWCPRCDSDFGECACVGTDQFSDTHGLPDVIVGIVPSWPDVLRLMRELEPRYALLITPRDLLTPDITAAFNDLGYYVRRDPVPGMGPRRDVILATDGEAPRLDPIRQKQLTAARNSRVPQVAYMWLRAIAAQYSAKTKHPHGLRH